MQEKSILFEIRSRDRHAIVKRGSHFCDGKYVVYFYYGGYADHEWKKGSHGIACDVCDTLEQAKRKANYYVAKDYR